MREERQRDGDGPAEPGTLPPVESPHDQANRLLAAARRAGDRRAEVAALTDLGVFYTRAGDARRAVEALELALASARQLAAPPVVCDVLGNLGLALVADGQSAHGLRLIEEGHSTAVAAGDRYAEKLALDNLGLASAELGDPGRALSYTAQALAVARTLGDRQHEADLVWLSAVRHAELGRRAEAVAAGREAVALFAGLGNPQADHLDEQLRRYEAAGSGGGLAPFVPAPTASGSFYSIPLAGPAPTGPPDPGPGPGLLKMALSAVRSVARFVTAGLRTTAPDTQRRRLETCSACPHHTGTRCRLCGCFTRAKVIMPHEECPAGKWPV